ncbi:uncharacterized protein LOC114517936 [Dendronephthya gigantea]|uniref:uncharacterized protein LOC114517936 n=1 Tax=Dendronephthya gigantea TaxID=151771 RepID=UPI001069A7ED|nr:uncharacterized protein LOC114517936 [Dendronephthya gigantea]
MIFLNIFSSVFFLFVHLATILYCVTQAQLSQFDIQSVNISRSEVDLFYINVRNTGSCESLQNIATEEIGATCRIYSTRDGLCSLQCSCLGNTSNFIVSKRNCVDERRFREGCDYVFGSWTWKNGWKWDTNEDQLPIVNIGSHGITTAINASAWVSDKCAVSSIDKYSARGLWETLEPVVFQTNNVVFFKLQGMWHFTWIFSELNSSRKEIEGRYIRVNIRCSEDNTIDGFIVSNDVSSCTVLKITGNRTHRYASNQTTDFPTSETDTNGEDLFSNKLVLIGFIAGGVLLLLLVVVTAVYCIHGKKFCLKSKTAVASEIADKYSCNVNNGEMVEHV